MEPATADLARPLTVPPPDLLEQLPTGVLLLRPRSDAGAAEDYALSYLNPAARRLLGYDPAAPATLRGQWRTAWLAGLLQAARRAAAGETLETLLPPAAGPAAGPALRLLGQCLPGGELLLSCLPAPGGEVETEALRAANVELRQAQAELRELNVELEARVFERTRELRHARAATERERQRLARFFEQAPAAICVHDGPELRFELVNTTYQQFFPGRALLGRPVLEALPEVAHLTAYHTTRRVYETGETFRAYELPVPLLDAAGQPQELYFDLVQQARYAESGQVDGVLVFAFDVTERVRARQRAAAAEADARAADQRLRRLVESLPLVTYESAPDGTTTYLSPQWLALTGQDPATFELTRWVEAVHPEDLAALWTSYEAARAARRPWEARFRVRAADGHYRWQYTRTVPQLDPATGDILRWHGSTLDIHESRELQDQLAEAEARFRALTQAVPVIIWTTDEQGRITYHNPEGLAYMGFSAEELEGGRLLEVLHPDDAAGTIAAWQHSVQTGEVYEHQYRLRRRDGQYRWTLARGVPRRALDGGRVVQWIGTNTDIHATRELQDELRRAEQRFRFLAESSPVFLSAVGPGGEVNYANQPLLDYLGATLAEYRAAPAGSYIHPAERAAVRARWAACLASGEAYTSEYRLRRHDGQYRWVQSRAAPLRDADGRILQWYGSATDVHEQREAQAAVRTAAEQLRHVLSNIPAAIAVFDDEELHVSFFNEPYQRTAQGRTRLGAALPDLLPDETYQGYFKALRRVLRTGRPFRLRETPLQLPAAAGAPAEARFMDLTFLPLRHAGARPHAVLNFGIDVTEQVRGRQQLLAANRQLTRTNADLDNFIYTASHDLRTPILNLEGLLQALGEELTAAAPAAARTSLAPLLGMMQDAVARFRHTIDQLTDLTRLPAAGAGPAPEIDLPALLEAVRLDLAPQMAASRAELTAELTAYPTLPFAEKNLRSILFNLLSNALKYRHPARPPRIRVSCHQAGGFRVLAVQDNGLGLDPAQQQRAFGLFERLHDHVEGSGLGLYMVKRLLENAGGRIEVESQPGEGATFRAYFPVTR